MSYATGFRNLWVDDAGLRRWNTRRPLENTNLHKPKPKPSMWRWMGKQPDLEYLAGVNNRFKNMVLFYLWY